MDEIHIIKNSIIGPMFTTIKSIFSTKILKIIKIGILVIVLLIILILYLKKRYKNNCEALENKYYQDTNEILKGVNYLLYHPSKIRYIYWTGGYDSTFLLIQALIVEGYQVQPIYIKCQNLDTKFSIDGRQNQDKEITTMKMLRKKFWKTFHI